ncbi:hypothetical protein JKP88DRAFT_267637 [Tribonema minus]|uniref:Uncharacterized protein n=1 Tax=Tribonema minus TaxID=303371 RepID=A0A836CK54_9STRA|nr:hypothetical protein JKP88DRAFT_267637 [Tribonema minus]
MHTTKQLPLRQKPSSAVEITIQQLSRQQTRSQLEHAQAPPIENNALEVLAEPVARSTRSTPTPAGCPRRKHAAAAYTAVSSPQAMSMARYTHKQKLAGLSITIQPAEIAIADDAQRAVCRCLAITHDTARDPAKPQLMPHQLTKIITGRLPLHGEAPSAAILTAEQAHAPHTPRGPRPRPSSAAARRQAQASRQKEIQS